MRSSTTKTDFAQNSIDYIVYNNVDAVRKLIYDCGFEASKNPHHLVEATKELIRKKGTSVITKLLKIHPDKHAILNLEKPTKKSNSCNSCSNDNYYNEDNFCGNCGHSNYNGSGDEDMFLDQFTDTSDRELEKYYKRIVKKSNINPTDQKLASEVQMVWNELRQRRLLPQSSANEVDDTPKEKEVSTTIKRDEIMMIGLSFLSGVVLCSVFKK
ncbi:hypothetical protein [Aquimarina longa]|uniref:hypothetical protein n=1 Tax=Aquimarina longa TaxID=1080221 RepID=UPI000782D491|nr:hypothetical protein [Aquimarina longa]